MNRFSNQSFAAVCTVALEILISSAHVIPVDKELRLKLKEFREENEPDAKIKSGKIIRNVDGGKGVVILYRPPK